MRGGAFDVEVVAHQVDGVFLWTVAEEESLEHKPVILRQQTPGGEEPVEVFAGLALAFGEQVDLV